MEKKQKSSPIIVAVNIFWVIGIINAVAMRTSLPVEASSFYTWLSLFCVSLITLVFATSIFVILSLSKEDNKKDE